MTGRILRLPWPWCECCGKRRADRQVPIGDIAEPVWVCGSCVCPVVSATGAEVSL